MGIGTWWLMNPAPPPPAALPAPKPLPAPSATPAPAAAPVPGAGAGPERKESLESVKSLLASGAEPDALVAAARERLAIDEPGPAFLLLRAAARKGSGDAALEIARFYDPEGFGTRPSPFPEANVVKSLEWYARAVTAGSEAAGAGLARTRDAVAVMAEAGDAGAAAALKALKTP